MVLEWILLDWMLLDCVVLDLMVLVGVELDFVWFYCVEFGLCWN